MTVHAPRARRYTARTVSAAADLYEAGWKPKEIQRMLRDGHGLDVSIVTIRTWVVPGEADRRRTLNAEANSRLRARRAGRPVPSSTPVLDRMLEMRRAGLSLTAVAAMLRLDGVADLSMEQVRYAVRVGREPVTA